VHVVGEKGLFSFCGFRERNPICDLLLTPAPDHHVALLQGDDLVVDDFNHRLFRAFVHQVGLGQDT